MGAQHRNRRPHRRARIDIDHGVLADAQRGQPVRLGRASAQRQTGDLALSQHAIGAVFQIDGRCPDLQRIGHGRGVNTALDEPQDRHPNVQRTASQDAQTGLAPNVIMREALSKEGLTWRKHRQYGSVVIQRGAGRDQRPCTKRNIHRRDSSRRQHGSDRSDREATDENTVWHDEGEIKIACRKVFAKLINL